MSNDTSSSSTIDPIDLLLEMIDSDSHYPDSNMPWIDIDSNGIPFGLNEWLVRDPATGKLRPPKLYEFLRLLLDNRRYISYASWLNQDEGLFKIHKPTEVIELWQKVKARQTSNNMDYDRFSRGIRHYYESGIMIATYTKHTYRFATKK
ncbi:hypothetical protein I4U23_024574 [Adineta vaga]|nr:hypothetical protein I4U23_024574 [Adineta vaga]